MYTTPARVLQMTGYTLDEEVVERAQFIIEAFTGRSESEVDNPSDLEVLGSATAFQAAYMRDNFEKVYEQVALTNKAFSDSSVSPDASLFAPFVAPLAVLTLRRLSWTRSRSVRVGGTFGNLVGTRWEMD